MKFIKIIIGIAASIFVIMHIFDVINKFNSTSQLSGGLQASSYMGNLVGLCVGIAVASLCFRKKKE